MSIDRISLPDNIRHAQQVARERVQEATACERRWWGDAHKRFSTPQERHAAIESGALHPVDFPNAYFGLPANLRGEINADRRHLNTEGLALLKDILSTLDSRTGFSERGIRLILTSLHRTDTYQDGLQTSDSWYRAANPGESSHASGAAFDINIRTHYVVSDSGELVGTWREGYEEKYDTSIIPALEELLQELQERNQCNYVIENTIDDGGVHPSVIHVCAAPKD